MSRDMEDDQNWNAWKKANQELPPIPPDSGIEFDEHGPYLWIDLHGITIGSGRRAVLRHRRVIAAVARAEWQDIVDDGRTSNTDAVAAEKAIDDWREWVSL